MRAAMWLLTRFGVDDSLIGDLAEHRPAGRSRAWIWFQSIAAVSEAIRRDVSRHPARALIGVFLGLILREGHKALWSLVWHYTNPAVARFLPIGSIHLGVALSWTNLLMAFPGWIVMGWLIARLTGTTSVVPYVIVSCILVGPDIWRQAGNAIEDVRYRPYFYIATIREALFCIAVVAGALSCRWPLASTDLAVKRS